jgi:hypothetical protein
MRRASEQSILERKLRIASAGSFALTGLSWVEKDIFPPYADCQVRSQTLSELESESGFPTFVIFRGSIESE